MIVKNVIKVFALMAFIIFSVSSQELEFKEAETEVSHLAQESIEVPQISEEETNEFLKERNLQFAGSCVREWDFCYSGGPKCCSGLTCNFVKQFCIKVQV